ncbi:MAG: TA system VapC family ribonuclease toxin [Phycicoccus sp.]
MLLDANVLLYSVDRQSVHHARCAAWVEAAFAGQRRIGLPWQTIGAFVRIATHPRVLERPLTAADAWGIVEHWMSAPVSWLPPTSERTVAIFGDLTTRMELQGNLVADGQLAALAIEHGLDVVSADSDFARFPEVRWVNPLFG